MQVLTQVLGIQNKDPCPHIASIPNGLCQFLPPGLPGTWSPM